MIEFYIGTTEYNLSTVLKAIFNEDNVSVTRYHVDSGEHHLAVSGTWETYKRIQDLPINTYFSLEHFEDDKVLNFPMLEDSRQLSLEFPIVEESKKVFSPFDAPEWHMFLQEEANRRGITFTQLMQKLTTIKSEEFDILQETFLHKFYKTNG
jgi:hypothetical protein